jgi:hypothetical protein
LRTGSALAAAAEAASERVLTPAVRNFPGVLSQKSAQKQRRRNLLVIPSEPSDGEATREQREAMRPPACGTFTGKSLRVDPSTTLADSLRSG